MSHPSNTIHSDGCFIAQYDEALHRVEQDQETELEVTLYLWSLVSCVQRGQEQLTLRPEHQVCILLIQKRVNKRTKVVDRLRHRVLGSKLSGSRLWKFDLHNWGPLWLRPAPAVGPQISFRGIRLANRLRCEIGEGVGVWFPS